MSGTLGLTLHHLNNSRSLRIIWLLEELSVEYTVKKYQRDELGHAPPSLLAINPLGKSPVITDGELTLAESGAIVDLDGLKEYLIGKYGKGRLVPTESGWATNLYFTWYAEGTLQPALIRRALAERSATIASPADREVFTRVLDLIDQKINTAEYEMHGNLIESRLEVTKAGWFAGGPEPTSADFMLGYSLDWFIERAPNCVGPRMREYLEKVRARPAYQRALQKVA